MDSFFDTAVRRAVERLEKEYDFWADMYNDGRQILGRASEQINLLHAFLDDYRERYRKELESRLGKGYHVGELEGGTINAIPLPLRAYFYPMNYDEKQTALILPFAKRKRAFFSETMKGQMIMQKQFFMMVL